MSSPTTKHSERLKNKRAAAASDDNPVEILRRSIFLWINRRVGWQLAAAFAMPFGIWAAWDRVEKLPGVNPLLTKIAELRRVAPAHGGRFSVVVSKLGNDNDGVHRRLVLDAFQGHFKKGEIEFLLLDRTIAPRDTDRPQDAIRAGHMLARKLLTDSNAHVMIWGEALDTKPNAPMRLHWTVNASANPAKSSEKYLPSDPGYDLPELFWADLADVLLLLASTQGSAFARERGSFVADRLTPFITSVRHLVVSDKLTRIQKAKLQVILAEGLTTYGVQRGDDASLQEAVGAYREVLKVYTREREPHAWAAVQNNLGSALLQLDYQQPSSNSPTSTVLRS